MTTPNIEELRLLAQTLEFSDAVRCSIQRAADLLQSQAERIAMLEFLNELAVKQAETLVEQRDTLRAELADAEFHTKQVERGLDKATAQLAEIEKIEPVAYMVQFSPGSRWVELTKEEFDSNLDGHIVYKKQAFFTHPMPAQRLTELKLLMLTTAYEQGVGKGIQRRDCNPYAADTDEHAAWKLGYEEGLDKPMPAQDVEDAERYRWLREQHWSTDTIAVVLNPKQAVKLGYVCPSDSLLDETIDAAIAKGAK